jgi:acyl-CoA thioesterase II
MTDTLQELIQLLTLEYIEENRFRGQSQNLGWGNVFGGQVLGQALAAASYTVPKQRLVHSLHAYFLLTGAADKPILYEVERVRDGQSFTTRRVIAIQQGRTIFQMMASFQEQESGFDHQAVMPVVPMPESLLTDQEFVQSMADRIPAGMRSWFLSERPIEARQVDPMNQYQPEVREPHRAVWYKAIHALPDDPILHSCLLAYMSDFHFLSTAMYPHGASWLLPGMQVASLDHSIWFHRPCRADEWLLHVVESPSASGARGMVLGKLFTRDGRLVATTSQEGLTRKRRIKPIDG